MPATALRLLLALTLVFNGVTSAWATVRPCHAATSANAVLEEQAMGALAPRAAAQRRSHDQHAAMRHAHGAMHGGYALSHGASASAGMDHRLCDGACCKGMACPGHVPAGAALQPTLPRTPKCAAARMSARLISLATRAHPFTPPYRPPAN